MCEENESDVHREHVVLGMFSAVGAFFCFTLMFMFSKLLSANYSVFEISFYRNVIAIVPFLVLIFAFGRRDILVIRAKPGLISIRAVLGVIGLFVTFYAFKLMPMADTTALLFTSSLFIPLLGVIFLRESVGPYRWLAIVAGFVGVVFMANPTGEVYVLGIVTALGAAMLHATLQIILRYLGPYESPETISFYFFAIGILIAALPMPWVATRPSLADVPLLLGVGLSGTGAQWLLSIAYRHARAAIVT
ncbi:MAG: DMT family transporter, partial [Lysobacterales bacterium]